LDRIDEVLREELLHHDFFQEFPDTTTGGQALAYIRNVWRRAQSTPGRLANEVRDVLPVAYAYCLDDCDRDGSLLRRWQAVASEALVFAGREWIVPTENEIVYFDDINDGRFLPKDMKLIFVTGGHLGNSQNEQLRTIDALGIRRLSSYINMEWNDVGGVSYDAGEWGERFHFILRLLQWIRGDEGEEGKGAKGELTEEIQLRRVDKLTLTINIRGDEYTESVPVNARLQENYRRLTVAGQPIQFGSDAARELVRYFSFGQRGDLAADLTGMLVAIGDQSAFELAVEKFRRAFARGFDLELPVAPCSDGGTNRIPDSRKQTEHGKSAETRGAGTAGVQEESSGRGTYGRDRVISQQNTLAEKLRSLTGELVPDDDVGLGEFQGTDGRFAGNTGDKMYREAAAQYEREQGREPEFGDPYQQGWDIRSVDPKNGAVRLIEVKGRGHPWVDDEVVELSRAQIRKAFETLNSQTEAWYLYVVEETDDGGYQTLPVSNPVGAAGRWILCGKLWRALAEDTP